MRRKNEKLESWYRRLARRSARMRRQPGGTWRMSAFGKTQRVTVASPELGYDDENEIRPRIPGETIFDELVVDDWFHLEQMDTRIWWLRVGDGTVLWIRVPRRGRVIVSVDVDRVIGKPKKRRRAKRVRRRMSVAEMWRRVERRGELGETMRALRRRR